MRFIYTILFLLSMSFIYGQKHTLLKTYIDSMEVLKTFEVRNGSFELHKDDSNDFYYLNIEDWDDVGAIIFENETPPTIYDIENDKSIEQFGVKVEPFHRDVFLGLVVREDSTYEGIGNLLKEPLTQNSQYSFSFYYNMSRVYFSPYPKTEYSDSNDFLDPVSIKIHLWDENDKLYLVKEIEIEKTLRWREQLISFKAPCSCDYFSVTLGYIGDEPYNGHVLLDAFSDIYEVAGKK